mgnify:CR=1 FL=1
MLRLFWRIANGLRALFLRLCALPGEAARVLADQQGGRSNALHRAFLIILPIAFSAAWLLPEVTLVMSPSIEAFAVRPTPGAIARGDLVMFELRHPIAGPNPVNVTKYALCLPGDRLAVVEISRQHRDGEGQGHYYCNGKLLGISLPITAKGIRLTHFHWNGPVPAGLAYVGSRHVRGFDSRYFGFVAIEQLTRMEPLL